MCPPVLQGVPQLALCMSEESEDHIKAATVWSVGQIGHHTPEHAKAVTTANLLPKILELYMNASSSEDLQTKVRVSSEHPENQPFFSQHKVTKVFAYDFLCLHDF